jgi:hypothetical protein
MNKICSTCNKNKNINNFAINKSKKDGLNGKCKECQREYLKEHYKKNKQYYIDKASESHRKTIEIKRQLIIDAKSKGCSRCGEKHIACLDFHHLKDKEFGIAKGKFSKGIDTLKKELNKCEVICSNCHRKLHWNDPC